MSEARFTFSGHDRRRSLAQAGAGAALFGGGMAASEGLNRRLRRMKAPGPYVGIGRNVARVVAPGGKVATQARPGWNVRAHLPHAAGKAGVRGLQAVGLPLAAYGAVNALRAKPKKARKIDVRHDIVEPGIHHALMADQVEAGEAALHRKVGKALTADEQRRLQTHRRIGRATALTGGTLGLGALALRAPDAAKFAAKRGVRGLSRVTRLEPRATRLSNTLGVTAIGTGSAGSFNYAAQQKLERKREPVIKNAVLLLDPDGAVVAKAVSDYHPDAQRRPDRFLRAYGTRISPQAEAGYRYLKEGRNRQAVQAAGAATMAGLGGWLTHHELRHGGKGPASAIAAAGTIGSAITALQSGRGAARWNAKMGAIKAKARSRRAQGLYGPGRGLSPADEGGR